MLSMEGERTDAGSPCMVACPCLLGSIEATHTLAQGGLGRAGGDQGSWSNDGGGSRRWKPFVPIGRDGGDDDASKPKNGNNDVTFMLSRHSHGASRRDKVSMYPWIKAVKTHDKGNAALEHRTKLALGLHPNRGRHPLDVALCARRKGDGFA